MLLRIAEADAYGIAVEFIKPGHKNYKNLLKFEHYYNHPNRKNSKGKYSDDCQMSCAVAEVLISGRPYTQEKFAQAFYEGFHRDKRKGYSRGFQTILEESTSWQDMVSKLVPKSEKNGAAMRSVSLGVLMDPNEVCEIAETQAKVTHNTITGVISSQIIGLVSHYAIYSDLPLEKYSLLDWLKQRVSVPEYFYQEHVGRVPCDGMITAHAVIDIVCKSTNLLVVLKNAVELGGDVDSVASISAGICSSRYNDELPKFFERELEPGSKFGVDFLKALGKELFEKVY